MIAGNLYTTQQIIGKKVKGLGRFASILVAGILLFGVSSVAQSYVQVMNTSGTTKYNGVNVTVTTSGGGSSSACGTAPSPYSLAASGDSYTFTFAAPVGSVKINTSFNASGVPGTMHVVRNGTSYAITDANLAGTVGTCDPGVLAVASGGDLTNAGNLSDNPNNIVVIPGPISTLTVSSTAAGGFLFGIEVTPGTYRQVTHTAGAAAVNGVTITVTAGGGTPGTNSTCGPAPSPYFTPGAGDNYNFSFSSAVDGVNVPVVFETGGAAAQAHFIVNGSGVTLTAGDINGAAASTCSPGVLAVVSAGDLTNSGNTTSNPNANVMLPTSGTVSTLNVSSVVSQGFVSGMWFTTGSTAALSYNNASPQFMTLCTNAAATSINSQLAVTDLNSGPTLTWSVVVPPANGVLSGFPYSTASTGGSVTPAGLTYQPNASYSGPDGYTIQVTDGVNTVTTVVNVTMYPSPDVSNFATSAADVCQGSGSLVTITSTSLADGTYNVTYNLVGANSATGVIGSVTMASGTGTFTTSSLANSGATTIIITTMTNPCAASVVSSGNVDGFTVNATPGAIFVPGPVCVGSTMTVASGTAGGTYSSSNTLLATVVGATGVVTGVGAGNPIITYMLGTGCFTTVVITVNPTPNAITGSNTVCTGYTTSLTQTTPGGTWSSSNPAVGSITSGGVVTGIIAGNINISYTLPAGCFVIFPMTVNTTPAANTGPTTVCTGLTITLANGTGGGTWSSSNVGEGTVDAGTGVVGGIAAGFPTITYTVPSGCFVVTPITVNTSPATIAGSSTVCVGANTTLTNSSGGGAWTSSNTLLGTVGAGTGVVTGIAVGTPTITYTLPNACFTTHAMTVNPNPAAITGTFTVCTGANTTLADATAGGTWASSNGALASVGAGTGVVTGNSAGVPTISYTLPTGCFAVQNVTVNQTPPAIGGSSTVCVANNTTLTNSTGGGAWSSSDGTVVAVGTATGITTGIGAGTANITYTMPTGCFVIHPMTVNPNPAAIAGTFTVCTGTNTTLTNGTAGGSWTSSNTGIATVGAGTGVVGGVAAGVATITYTLGTGCFATQAVTVIPSPAAIGGPTSVCVGSTIVITNATAGGTWSSSSLGLATVGAGTGLVTGMSAGVPTMTYTASNGCIATQPITVNPTPATIGGASVVCTGFNTVLTNSTTGGTWTSSDVTKATVGPATGIVSGAGAGTVTITYSLATGCFVTHAMTVNASPTPIAGTTNVCIGFTTTLSNSIGGGTWSSSNTALGTVDAGTGVVTGIASGVPTISYILTSTGCYATTPVTVNPNPASISGTPVACVGSTTTLTNTSSGGTWTSGNTGQATIGSASGVMLGVAAGNPVITYMLPTTCYTTTIATIDPLPAAITGTMSVCIGFTTTLADATAGGTWSSSNTAIGTVGAATGVVGGIATGVVTITYTLPTGCFTTTSVTVNPNPPAITGTTNVCVGSTTTLFNATGGGTWTSSNTGLATVGASSGVVSGVLDGTLIITYTLPTSCFITTPFTVNPLPAGITGTTSVCVGLTTTLANASSGGTWSSSNTAIGTVGAATGVVGGISAGTTTITYTLPTGCIATTTVTVNANPTSITGTPVVCTGYTTTLASTPSGGAWTSSNIAVGTVGAGTGIVGGVTAGNATITYTLPTGCITTVVATVNQTPVAIAGTMSVCVGLTTTLTDATPGGSWSSSNTSQAVVGPATGIVTGVAAGIPVITYTMPTGCYATTPVTVNSNPAMITGANNVCTGATIGLSDATPGGVWSSSDATRADIGSATGIVTGIAAGTANITYMLSTGCIAVFPVTVNQTPAAISGVMSVCTGSTTTLANATVGGSWSSSNVAIATVGAGTGVVSGLTAGTVTISYAMSTGCYALATVTVNQTPGAITGTMAVCVGATTALSNTTAGGLWSSSNTSEATVGSTTGIVSGVAIGTPNITYAMPTGCFAVTNITVNPTPAAITGTTVVCAGSTTTLSDATSGGTWSSANTAIATVGSTTGVVTGVSAGVVGITYSLGAGCYAATIVTVNPVPDISNFTSTTATSPCLGNSSTVTVASNSLGSGTFTVTYNLSGANSVTGATATLTMGSTTGTFTIPSGSLTASGFTTVTITAITNSFGCTSFPSSSNSYMFAVNALPTVYTVTGGGAYCVGGTGVHIYLSNSVGGVNYQLWLGATAVGAPLAGTFSGLDFGLITTVGTYTVTATNATTGCMSNMSGSATVSTNPLPTAFSVTGGGSYCAGGSGVAVGLSGSQTSTNYQLYVGGSPTGSPLPGTGSSLAFGLQTTAGVYTVVATNTSTTCTNSMTGSATVVINPLPSAITGTMFLCPGTTTTLSSATSGGTWTSSTPAVATVGTSTGVVMGITPGTAVISYTLSTGCLVTATVTVNPNPAAIAGPSSVCVGSSITLTNSTGGGTWTSSNSSLASINITSGVVLGVAAGTPTMTYTLSTGCYSVYTITVNPTPASISGASNVCVGQTTTLTNATSGGTWSSSNAAVGSIASATGVAGGVSAGTVTITYTLPAGCNTTTPFTVNPIPGAITGVTNVCVGLTTTLANAVSGGNWTSSNGSIASVNVSTGVVTGNAAGIATITYTLPAGCFITTNVTVNPSPASIAGTNNVCVGLTTTLTNATSGGTWTSSNPAVGTIGAATGIVGGVSAGTITITYTLSAGSCNTTFAFTVNPNPAAIAGVTNTCVGSTSTLTDATTGGTWSSSNVAIGTVGGATGVVGGIAAGTINITYALSTGCIATTPFTVNPLPAAITGNTPVCAGSNISLANASTGGTWVSSNPSVATVGSSSGIVGGVAAGNATITYTLPTGCLTTTVVTVHPTPAAIAGASFVCVGQTTTLTDATSGGTWSSSNTAIGTVGAATGVVGGISVGVIDITYTLPPGGCIAVKSISVNPMPGAITGNTPVCEGANITLSNSVGGGTWTTANPAIATVGSTTGVVMGVAAGTVMISYTLPGGCFVTTIVTVNPSPATIAGSNNVCVGSSTTLTNSVTGGLWSSSATGTATIGSTSGIVNGISAGSLTITYTLPAGCFTTLAFTVNPLPASITGTTQACEAGGTSTLSNTSTGGTWTSSNTSVATVGPSSGLVTGVTAGTVTITYTLPTGCFTTIGFIVNPLPAIYTVTGGGTYCAGGSGVTVGLSNSQTGVNYQLYVGGTATGSALSGTGSPLSFGLQTTAGTYTVVAKNATTLCENNMSGTALVTVTVLPTVYNMTGGGGFCAGGTGVAVGLNGSQSGRSYQLYNGMTPIGSPIAGTGSAISWGLISGAGTYTAVAIHDTTACTSNMAGTAVVIVNSLPTQFTVTGGGSYCSGGTGVSIGLSGSQVGVNYTVTNGSSSATLAGTGGPLTFGLFTSTGTYTVTAVHSTTGCANSMLGSASVGVFALPTAHTVGGGGAYCAGGSGVSITLNPSTTGVNYQLMFGGSPVGSPVAGTGGVLTFSSITGAGTYTIVGTHATTGCQNTMSGTATVTINPVPTVYPVGGGGGYCVGGTGRVITVSPSDVGFTYRLYLSGTTLMGSVSGSGSTVSFSPMTTAGTYTVTSQNIATGCLSAMSGSAVIVVNPLPSLYSVTGGGSYCAGSTGLSIGLTGSDLGINYQLWLGGTAIGSPMAGTGGTLSFGTFTTGGTYTVVATNPLTGCSATMSSSALITVNPLPALWTVSGGGSYCSGGAGVTVSLSGSSTGTSYQLLVGGVPTGIAMLGTGTPITFTSVTIPGTYTVRATIIATGCNQLMTGTAVVVVNPLPAVNTVTGGGSYCTGGVGVHVGIGGSVTGVNYQTYVDGVLVGSPMAGTGSAMDFGLFTTAGTYTVVGTNALTGCSSTMTGSVVVAIDPLPTVYTVTGGGGYCAGGTGVHIGVSNSDAGVEYQLYNGVTPMGVAIAGTGAALDFGLVTITGTYSVQATNTSTGCSSWMTGSVVVSINPLPGTFTVTGGGNYCPGGSGVMIGLGGSSMGVNYQLMNGSSPVGSVVAGTGAPISFGLQTGVGTYTVQAIDATTACTNTMTGVAVVALHALPTVYSMTGGGGYCVGGTGADVMLSGSSTGVTYQLYLAGMPVGPSVLGTGSSINFGPQSAVGTYTAVATDVTTTCTNNMAGSVTVSLNPLPIAYNVTGGGGYCAGGTGVNVGLGSSDISISYQLYRDGIAIGSPLAGTGGPISYGLQTVTGIYTVVATNTITSCMSNMTGSASVIINALPLVYNVTGGGSYCSGGTGLHVFLSTSDAGINYQLYNGSTAVGSTIAGTGSMLDFGLFTAIGTYSVTATNAATGCMSNMTGSATITINALPTVYAMTGGGSYCAGGAGLPVGTTGSNTGINYQLLRDGVNDGLPMAGTGSALAFGLKTTGGVYTVVATNAATGCVSNMSGAVTIVVNPLPNVDTVSGGGNYCPGGSGVHVGLTGSTVGINYQLMRGTTMVGAPMAGTGSGLDFGAQTITGTYFVVATNPVTGCTINMAGSTAVNISALPTAYTVATSASGYCFGGTGVTVTLSGSSVGVQYQLYRNGTIAVGSPMAGTGFPLSYGLHTNPGTYSVTATDLTTGCVNNMSGTPTIVINPLPTPYTVSGGGSYCAGGAGVHIMLSGSDMGVNYQLKNGSASVGSPMAGTGFSLDFGAITGSGTYTVEATNVTTGCSNTMLSSAGITINALPTIYFVVGGGSYCAGGAGVNIGINNSQTGISYQLMNGTATVGSPVAGTGSSINFGPQTATGSYTVVATNTTTGCTSTMSGSATVAITALPAAFTMTGGGNYCTGGTGVVIGLAGSATGVNYQLMLPGSVPVGSPVAGTGGAISFGLHLTPGTYTVEATSTTTGCPNTMTGSAIVTVSSLPTAYTVAGGGNYCASVPGVNVSLSNSDLGVNYQLYNGSSTVGGAVAGTGLPLSFGLQPAGTYTVMATNASTGCTNSMTGSVTVTLLPSVVPSVSITTGVGDTVCAGTSVTFTALAVNGGTPTFEWFVNGVSVSTAGSSYTYIPTNGNVVSVTMTSSATCAIPATVSSTKTMTVKANVAPAVSISVSPSNTVCQGVVVTFTPSPVWGGTTPTFTWYVNGSNVATGNTYSYAPVDGDVVFCSMMSSYACVTTTSAVLSNNIAMHVDDATVPTVSIMVNSGVNVGTVLYNDTLTAVTTNAGTNPQYQWSINGMAIAGATNATYLVSTLNHNDAVGVTVSKLNACGLLSANDMVIVTSTNVGVTNVTTVALDLTLIPNPNKGIFTIKGSLGSNADQEATIEMTNMLGQRIYTGNVTVRNGVVNETVKLDNSVANGMYMLTFRTGGESKVFHVVVEQ
ncbi:MAG: surface protein [Flavipsychrobacter sp.]|jgi:uncharacterized protein YjdB|nr:surface protein [Flavipsychrobacter sp.]